MKKGFTLIELLVVISIIGILASLTFVSYSGAQKQTRDTQRRSDLAQYRNGLENYAASNNGLYPIHTSAFNVTGFCGSGNELDEFLSGCPGDPLADTDGPFYYYISDDLGTGYILYADLETAGYWYVCSNGKSDTSEDPPAFATCLL
ncbi:hypothetical protein A2Z41_02795 [Microgenomates group bacterium RBG_19FT_COMBO_39_10]|nr:MAG: hypothetical protein A2Z41_02795 [Microgenomates group bacterium RBG_19FT_COMBO_39_10]